MIDIIAQHPAEALALFTVLLAGAAWSGKRLAEMAPSWATAVMFNAGIVLRSIVLEVAQTYTDELRRGREDGHLTDEEKRQAAKMAWDKALSLLKWGQLRRVFKGQENAEQWAKAEIEAAVLQHKTSTAGVKAIQDPTERSLSIE